jgi:hypothetical protein
VLLKGTAPNSLPGTVASSQASLHLKVYRYALRRKCRSMQRVRTLLPIRSLCSRWPAYACLCDVRCRGRSCACNCTSSFHAQLSLTGAAVVLCAHVILTACVWRILHPFNLVLEPYNNRPGHELLMEGHVMNHPVDRTFRRSASWRLFATRFRLVFLPLF